MNVHICMYVCVHTSCGCGRCTFMGPHSPLIYSSPLYMHKILNPPPLYTQDRSSTTDQQRQRPHTTEHTNTGYKNIWAIRVQGGVKATANHGRCLLLVTNTNTHSKINKYMGTTSPKSKTTRDSQENRKRYGQYESKATSKPLVHRGERRLGDQHKYTHTQIAKNGWALRVQGDVEADCGGCLVALLGGE